jgi:Caspase domain
MMHTLCKLMFAGLALLMALLQPAFAQKRVALVVGNNAYRNVPVLEAAVSDAKTIGNVLQGIGFVVTLALDATAADTVKRLQEFEGHIETGDLVVIFFAGHGVEIRNRNYLLPVDVPAAADAARVVDASVAADVLLERVSKRSPGATVLVLDACRDNPFEPPGSRSVAGLAGMLPTGRSFILFSAGVRQTALDRLDENDRNPNSVFTRHFARELARPGRTMVEIAKTTQVEVRRTAAAVRHPQTPAYYDEIVGDLVLSAPVAGNSRR